MGHSRGLPRGRLWSGLAGRRGGGGRRLFVVEVFFFFFGGRGGLGKPILILNKNKKKGKNLAHRLDGRYDRARRSRLSLRPTIRQPRRAGFSYSSRSGPGEDDAGRRKTATMQRRRRRRETSLAVPGSLVAARLAADSRSDREGDKLSPPGSASDDLERSSRRISVSGSAGCFFNSMRGKKSKLEPL